jgi:hypothetical protein
VARGAPPIRVHRGVETAAVDKSARGPTMGPARPNVEPAHTTESGVIGAADVEVGTAHRREVNRQNGVRDNAGLDGDAPCVDGDGSVCFLLATPDRRRRALARRHFRQAHVRAASCSRCIDRARRDSKLAIGLADEIVSETG